MHFGARHAHDAFDGRQRQREEFLAGAHDERLADRERERQAHGELRALARPGLGVERAAELLDLGRDHVHADAAAGRLRHLAGGRESGLEDQLQRLLVRKLLLRRHQPERDRAVAHELEIHARAVVGDGDDDFRALALQRDVDDAGLVLAAGDAGRRQFDAVDDGVADHVLEGRQHPLQHLAVELARGAVDADLHLLAGFGRGLARDAREALNLALERDHARAHEPALQFGNDAALLREQVLDLARLGREQALHARDVRRRLAERARILLDRRVAVELERIEVVAARAGIHVPMQDLRLGLDLELAQLVFQALNDAAEFRQVEVDRRHLLLEPRAVDAHLARDVQHVVEQVRVHARDLAAIGRGVARRRSGGHGSQACGALFRFRRRLGGFLGGWLGAGSDCHRRGAAAAIGGGAGATGCRSLRPAPASPAPL